MDRISLCSLELEELRTLRDGAAGVRTGLLSGGWSFKLRGLGGVNKLWIGHEDFGPRKETGKEQSL